MSHEQPRRQVSGSPDPEAEQEVELGRYWRLLVSRWWVVAAGIVIGALVGYAISIAGGQPYTSSATIYIGQPFTSGGNSLQTLQSNPSAVEAILESPAVIRQVARACKGKPADIENGITSEKVPGAFGHAGQNPIVAIDVEAKRAKESACAANHLARQVVDRINGFAEGKIRNYRRRIAADQQSINIIKAGIGSSAVTTTDKLLFQLQLRNFQADQIAAGQLVLQATQVENPRVLTPAIPEKATAPSRRNAIAVAAVIGLVIGVLLALTWDRFGARLIRRNGN